MRWKAPVEPQIGDEKTTARFAYSPTRLDDGYTVWLEYYTVHLRYETRDVATKGGWIPKTRWFDCKTELFVCPPDFGGYD
jgi:hypothetical protein